MSPAFISIPINVHRENRSFALGLPSSTEGRCSEEHRALAAWSARWRRRPRTRTVSRLRMQHVPRGNPRETIVIIGGGITGLSTAVELAQRPAAPQVIVVSRRRSESAAVAAGGMLAPQGERLPPGPLLELCLAARERYAQFVRRVEQAAGGVSTGYDPCGLLAPAFPGDAVHGWRPPADAGEAYFLSADEARQLEPGLTSDAQLAGAWLFPQDGQVDNVALMEALTLACGNLGVRLMEGNEASCLVAARHGKTQRIEAVRLASGNLLYGNAFILASGAWARQLVPVPVKPQKGQMLSISAPGAATAMDLLVRRVLYGADLYMAPKRLSGKIVIGSTVEDAGFDNRCTARGISGLLQRLEKLCPALADWTLDRTWSGFRPLTPDLLPILGPSMEYSNMYYALGHWRNGILLAPLVAQVVADQVLGTSPTLDTQLLRACRFERFTDGAEKARSTSPPHSPRSAAYPVDASIGGRAAESPAPMTASSPGSPDAVAGVSLGTDKSANPNGSSAPAPAAQAVPGTLAADAAPSSPEDESEVLIWKIAEDGSLEPVAPGSGIPAPPDPMKAGKSSGAAVQWPWAVLDALDEERLKQVLEETRVPRTSPKPQNGTSEDASSSKRSTPAPAPSTSPDAYQNAKSAASLNAYDDISIAGKNGTTSEASRPAANATGTHPATASAATSREELFQRMREGIAAALREYEQDWKLDITDDEIGQETQVQMDTQAEAAAAQSQGEKASLPAKEGSQGADAVRQSMFDAFAQIRNFMENPKESRSAPNSDTSPER